MFDDHVDGKVGRVPVFVNDDDIFARSADCGRDGVNFANACESEAAERLCADFLLLEVGIIGWSATGNGVGRGHGRFRQDAFPGDALEGVVEDVEAAGGIVDVRGEKRGFATEVRRDELATLVIDAA